MSHPVRIVCSFRLHEILLVLSVTLAGHLFAQTVSIPIASLVFEGNQALDTARLKSWLRISREGGWYHPETLTLELQNLERYCQDEGFLHARIGPPLVDLQAVPGKGQVAFIRIPVSEGSRFTVGEIAVTNAQALSPATLLLMAPLRTGQPYSRGKAHEWKEKIEEAYRSLGYLRFESRLLEHVHELRHVVDCVLECKEGNPYRVGRILVVGDESIDRVQFKKRLLVGEGSPYSPEMLSLSIQILNGMRIYRPIAERDIEVKIDDARSTVDLVLHVESLRKPSSRLLPPSAADAPRRHVDVRYDYR